MKSDITFIGNVCRLLDSGQENEFSSAIHENRAGATTPTRSESYSILALHQLLT